MNCIKLSGNNGSVPPHLFYQFEITLFENDSSVLNVFNGRELNNKTIDNASISITPGTYQKICSLLKKLKRVCTTPKYKRYKFFLRMS